jgi:hypothetical protein
MLIWSICWMAKAPDRRVGLKRLLLLHAFPVVFIAAYFLLFASRLQIGGSEGATAGNVAIQSLGLAVGLGNGINANLVVAAVGLCFCAAVLFVIARSSRSLIALFLPGVLLIPLGILIVAELRHETRLSPRHFLPAIVLFILAVSIALGECWRWRGDWRITAIKLIAIFLGANLVQCYKFTNLGRGHYFEAFSFMLADNAVDPTLSLSSDSPNRTQMILDFYWQYVPHDTRIQYIPPADVARAQPNWYIGESDSGEAAERVIDGLRYARRASYPCYGLSGESWTIYERIAQ